MTFYREHRPPAGFSLLELMTVMGVIAVLAGIGIGFLTKSQDDMEVVRAVLRDKIRLAYETARNSGRPTRVELLEAPGSTKTEPLFYLQAKVLAPVGQWHLERDERPFQNVKELSPDVSGGEYDDEGRYGACMRPHPDNDASMFVVSTRHLPRFDLSDGFALRIEVNLDVREKCVIAKLGRTFSLELDDDLRPIAGLQIVTKHSGDKYVELSAPESDLPLGRWVSLEIVHDGNVFRLAIDGEEVARAAAVGRPKQDRQVDQMFEVSPNSGLVQGRIDEIQLLAYRRDDPAPLPAGVEIRGLERPVLFDRRGNLESPVTIEMILADQKERRTVAPGGVLE